jgi:hypothetical protein
MGTVFSAVWDGIKAVFGPIWDGITGAISWAWDNVIKPVADKIGQVFGAVWGGLKTLFHDAWDGIKLAFTNFPEFVKRIFNKIIGFMNTLVNGIVDAFLAIPGLLVKAFNLVKSAIGWIIGKLQDAWNSTLGSFKVKTPGWLPFGMGGKEFGFGKIGKGAPAGADFEYTITRDFHDIPGLAKGGTVLPRSGGTLVNVAEAGRAERIEPLDKDGLSKRDRAMIAMLAGGGAGGITINVHPSPGMNEVELAALVNRQLAFELRKGAA